MSKTPASTLKEYMERKGEAPTFHFAEKTATANSGKLFLCEGFADGKRCVGEGRTKQAAKQECCELLMRALSLNYSEAARPSAASPSNAAATPPPPSPTDNRIGRLLELCRKYDLPPPQFEDVDVAGPPHLRRFRVRCALGALEREASAASKQLARHAAASAMIECLAKDEGKKLEVMKLEATKLEAKKLEAVKLEAKKLEAAAKKPEPCPGEVGPVTPEERKRRDGIAAARFAELDHRGVPKSGKGMPISLYHLAFRRMLNEAQYKTIRAIVDDYDDADCLPKVAKIFATVGAPIEWSRRRSKADPIYCASIWTLVPQIVIMAAGPTPALAKRECAKKLLQYVRGMMM